MIREKSLLAKKRQLNLRNYWRSHSDNLAKSFYSDDTRIDVEFFEEDDGESTNEIIVVENKRFKQPICIKINDGIDDIQDQNPIVIEDDLDTNFSSSLPISEKCSKSQFDLILIDSDLEDGDRIPLTLPQQQILVNAEKLSQQEITEKQSKSDLKSDQVIEVEIEVNSQNIIQSEKTQVVNNQITENRQQQLINSLDISSISDQSIQPSIPTTPQKSKGKPSTPCQDTTSNSFLIEEQSRIDENSNTACEGIYREEIVALPRSKSKQKEEKQWFSLKSAGQVPLAFFSEWKFKEVDQISVDFSVKHSHLELFSMFFTQDLSKYLIECIESEYNTRCRELLNADGWSQPEKVTSYDIEAFISLILHFRCLNRPNQLNTIQANQTLMEKSTLDWIIANFSLGSNDSIDGFINILNDQLKSLMSPKEFLTSVTHDLLGLDLHRGESYLLKEFRLADSEHNFILDIQFDKLPPKSTTESGFRPYLEIDDPYTLRVLEKQSIQLSDFQHKAHKVIILNNEVFDFEAIMKLRMVSIGVITTVPLNSLSLSRRQLAEINSNQNNNAFFIHSGEVAAAVTPHTLKHSQAYLSNFIALSHEKDFENPKIQRTYIENSNSITNSGDQTTISERHLTGVNSLLLIFMRVIDAIISNCLILHNLVYPREKISNKQEFARFLTEQLAQKYQGFRSLSEKVAMFPSKDIRLHLFKELLTAKKLECVICHSRTKNYCVQCSENSNAHIGFCGMPACVEAHNQPAARILNEKVDLTHQQKKASSSNFASANAKNNTTFIDRAYESSTEGKSIRPNRTFTIGSNNRTRNHDGYQSETSHISPSSFRTSRTFTTLRGSQNESPSTKFNRGFLSEENSNPLSISNLLSKKKPQQLNNSDNEEAVTPFSPLKNQRSPHSPSDFHQPSTPQTPNSIIVSDPTSNFLASPNVQAPSKFNLKSHQTKAPSISTRDQIVSNGTSAAMDIENEGPNEKDRLETNQNIESILNEQFSNELVKKLLFGNDSAGLSTSCLTSQHRSKSTEGLREICDNYYDKSGKEEQQQRSKKKNRTNSKFTFNINEQQLLEILQPPEQNQSNAIPSQKSLSITSNSIATSNLIPEISQSSEQREQLQFSFEAKKIPHQIPIESPSDKKSNSIKFNSNNDVNIQRKTIAPAILEREASEMKIENTTHEDKQLKERKVVRNFFSRQQTIPTSSPPSDFISFN